MQTRIPSFSTPYKWYFFNINIIYANNSEIGGEIMFKQKYEIIPRYLTGPSKRRPMIPMGKVLFMVGHDTGNPGSTATGNVSYYESSRNEMSASAHTFISDKEIIECIPLLTGKPEKAWHVVYDQPIDNHLYGDDANDAAGGVELCHGGKINLQEAYKRYVWYMAYACYRFGLDPATKLAGHYELDPTRRTDPLGPLKQMGKTFDDFVQDVVAEYNDCLEDEEMRDELEALKKRVAELEAQNSMPVPEWAQDAVEAATKTTGKDGKPLIDTPDGRSYDFYSTITVLHRKGVF
jgi:N-acetylmuramoyl-L-alanine amidase